MPTINLTTKYLEDSNGNKYAPVTVPSAVRWSNGDDLDDKLGGKQDSIVFNSTYNASSNKAATMADIPSSLPANGGNAATVNSHTVQSNVPANAVFTDTTYSVMGASGSGHASGLVPDTPSTAGTTKFLREDGTWQIPESGGSVIPVVSLYEPSTPEAGMVMFDAGGTNKFYQYRSGAWREVSTPHKAIGVSRNGGYTYEIIDGVLSQTPIEDLGTNAWYIYYIETPIYQIGQVIFIDEYYGGGMLPTWDDIDNWNKPIGLPVGSGTVTNLASLPVTNRMIVATISANQSTVSISGGVSSLTAGCELHVVVNATAAVTITLPTSSPYINMNADTTLSLAANSYAEINFISDGTNIYVRAIS